VAAWHGSAQIDKAKMAGKMKYRMTRLFVGLWRGNLGKSRLKPPIRGIRYPFKPADRFF